MSLQSIALKAIEANPSQVQRLELAAPTAQYKAVSPRLAAVVAERARVTVNRATWALIDAFKANVSDEDVNEDF